MGKFRLGILPIFFFFFLFSILSVSAVPPITTEFVGNFGLDIESNVQDYYKTNEGAEVHIWVFNKSDGSIMTGNEVSCRVELSDKNGTEVLSGFPTAEEDHFHMIRPPNIVKDTGVYGLTILCNDSSIGGYKTHFFEATSSGVAGINITWIIILAILIAIVLISYGFSKEEHPPIVLGAFLFFVISLYIWNNGFGQLGSGELITQLIAFALFTIAATLSIKSLSELK